MERWKYILWRGSLGNVRNLPFPCKRCVLVQRRSILSHNDVCTITRPPRAADRQTDLHLWALAFANRRPNTKVRTWTAYAWSCTGARLVRVCVRHQRPQPTAQQQRLIWICAECGWVARHIGRKWDMWQPNRCFGVVITNQTSITFSYGKSKRANIFLYLLFY